MCSTSTSATCTSWMWCADSAGGAELLLQPAVDQRLFKAQGLIAHATLDGGQVVGVAELALVGGNQVARRVVMAELQGDARPVDVAHDAHVVHLRAMCGLEVAGAA